MRIRRKEGESLQSNCSPCSTDIPLGEKVSKEHSKHLFTLQGMKATPFPKEHRHCWSEFSGLSDLIKEVHSASLVSEPGLLFQALKERKERKQVGGCGAQIPAHVDPFPSICRCLLSGKLSPHLMGYT